MHGGLVCLLQRKRTICRRFITELTNALHWIVPYQDFDHFTKCCLCVCVCMYVWREHGQRLWKRSSDHLHFLWKLTCKQLSVFIFLFAFLWDWVQMLRIEDRPVKCWALKHIQLRGLRPIHLECWVLRPIQLIWLKPIHLKCLAQGTEVHPFQIVRTEAHSSRTLRTEAHPVQEADAHPSQMLWTELTQVTCWRL